MLNCWVTETKETPLASKALDDLGEIEQRAGQPVDLVDHDDIDLAGADIGKKPLQGRALHCSPGIPAIVIVRGKDIPAFMALAQDEGLASLALGMQGIELLLEPFVGGFAGIDGAAQAPRLLSHPFSHWPGPPWSALQAKEGPAVPVRASDGAGDGAQARIGLAAPGEALLENEYLMGFAVPFPEELRAFAQPGPLGLRSGAVRPIGLAQELQCLGIEAAEGLHLNPIGHGADEEFAARLSGWLGSPESPPLLAQLAIGAIRQGEDLCGDGVPHLALTGRSIARAAASSAGGGQWPIMASSLGGAARRDMVAAHAVLADLRGEGKLELLLDEPAEEAPYGVRLPAGLGDDVLDGHAGSPS